MSVKITGMKEFAKEITDDCVKIVQSNAKLVEDDITKNLYAQKGAPKKSQFTILLYQTHGGDTKNWLVRFGEAMKLSSKNTKNGVETFAADPKKVLPPLLERFNPFILSPEAEEKLTKIIENAYH